MSISHQHLTNAHLLDHYADQLEQLKQQGNLRQFKSSIQQGRSIQIDAHRMLNLSSNDYLGLAADLRLREEFFDLTPNAYRWMSSSSSRLLTGNFPEYDQLEFSLTQVFGRSALLFNSGYHMNIGILPAICDARTLVLSDTLIHASMIDGIRLSKAQCLRFPHNDLNALEQLIQQHHEQIGIDRIIVVTESIFSMDGDEANLTELVALKRRYAKLMLYVDEAHAIGMRGERGLGCAEQQGVIHEIDFLVGTFGKAKASIGGYLICEPIIREFLINRMRSLIFSTAQAPINMAWTHFILHKVMSMQAQRQHLQELSQTLQKATINKGYDCPSSSHIVPIIIGESQATVEKAQRVQQAGFYVMPVRPPTVPQGSSRLRICLNAQVNTEDLNQLMACL